MVILVSNTKRLNLVNMVLVQLHAAFTLAVLHVSPT